jgi:hypothetical protein
MRSKARSSPRSSRRWTASRSRWDSHHYRQGDRVIMEREGVNETDAFEIFENHVTALQREASRCGRKSGQGSSAHGRRRAVEEEAHLKLEQASPLISGPRSKHGSPFVCAPM